jgi:3-hydroxyisobutyrate dehydrogenase-like beta-hydroxyacid dehydrogenase
MNSISSVTVIGLGVMGGAYLERLEHAGIPVRGLQPRELAGVSFSETDLHVVAVRSGHDALEVVTALEGPAPVAVCNLTTQSLPDTRACAAAAASLGTRYYGGGIIGGASQAASGCADVLLGPPPPVTIVKVVEHFGRLHCYPTADVATAAKVLHNLVLVVENHIIAASLQLAALAGVERLEEVLDLGTAGRKPSQSSAVRDYRSGQSSSYTGTLVAKDVRALLMSFPALPRLSGIDLDALGRFYETVGDSPYTVGSLQSLAWEDE